MKVVELLVLLIDCSSGSNVDEKGGKDDDPTLASIHLSQPIIPVASGREYSPDGAVKRGNTENIPLSCNPAPEGSIAVSSKAVFVLEENVYKRRNEGNAVAA